MNINTWSVMSFTHEANCEIYCMGIVVELIVKVPYLFTNMVLFPYLLAAGVWAVRFNNGLEDGLNCFYLSRIQPLPRTVSSS